MKREYLPILVAIFVGLIMAVAIDINSKMVNNYQTVIIDEEPVDEESDEEGPDLMLLPLPGGVPVGGGLYIW